MAKINVNMASNLFLVVIFLIIIFQTLADTSDDVGAAAGNVSSGNSSETFPLTSFFKKKGIILLALMAGVAITIIKSVLPSGK